MTHASAIDLALAVVIAGGVALRLWDLGRSRLTYDESFTAMEKALETCHQETYQGRC